MWRGCVLALLLAGACGKDQCKTSADCQDRFVCTNIGECRAAEAGRVIAPPITNPDSGVDEDSGVHPDAAPGDTN